MRPLNAPWNQRLPSRRPPTKGAAHPAAPASLEAGLSPRPRVDIVGCPWVVLSRVSDEPAQGATSHPLPDRTGVAMTEYENLMRSLLVERYRPVAPRRKRTATQTAELSRARPVDRPNHEPSGDGKIQARAQGATQ